MNLPSTGNYETFFGLKLPPFGLAPDPRFLFAGASHSAALAEVAYAIERREPIVVVAGEIGTGKTLLCRAVLQRLPRRTFVSIVGDPMLGPDDLLRQLLEDFGVVSRDWTEPASARRHDLVQAMDAFLRSLAGIDAHAVVIIDEAQHLQPAVLEQIRLLANVEDERGTLLQIVLAGQSDVEPLLSKPEMRQVQQRVTRRIRLEPLTHDEVRQYIEYRLERAREGEPPPDVPGAAELARALAEWEGPSPRIVFEPAAADAVSTMSRGIPRLINLLCDRALEIAFAAGRTAIEAGDIEAAARALGMTRTREAAAPAVATSAEPSPVEPARQPPGSAAPATEPMDWGALAAAADARTAPQPADEEWAPALLAPPKGRRRGRTSAIVAAVLVTVAVAGWIGSRVLARREVPAVQTAPRNIPPAPRVDSRPSSTAPMAASPAAPGVPAAPDAKRNATAGTAPASTQQPVAATAPGTDGGYELVVASFKTEARAIAVEDEIARLGIPATHRSAGAWEQVICGPFASRAAAEESRARLAQAGYPGAQVAAARR